MYNSKTLIYSAQDLEFDGGSGVYLSVVRHAMSDSTHIETTIKYAN